MRENIRTLSLSSYMAERESLDVRERSHFDFLMCTGTRVSESLMVKKDDIDWEKNRVNVHTLKNPSDPYRAVKFFPENEPVLMESMKNWWSQSDSSQLWEYPHRRTPSTYVWELARKTFNCTTHSFRHTNATLFCRAVRPNLNELMSRYGWKDPKPALIYIKYAFDESLDEKIKEFYQKGGKL